MSQWQIIITVLLGSYALVAFVLSLYQVLIKKNIFGLSPAFVLIGSFVWGDSLVFGFFWLLVSVWMLVWSNWYFLLLLFSIFWLIRSIGEMFYWLNQQFSSLNLNPPERFWLSRFFPGNSVWFIYQIFWQCLAVLSLAALIFLLYFYFL